MDVWIQNSLALDDEYNYTNSPNDNAPSFNIPQLNTTAVGTIHYQNTDSISTFRSKTSSAKGLTSQLEDESGSETVH
jgi:hypothetical protein